MWSPTVSSFSGRRFRLVRWCSSVRSRAKEKIRRIAQMLTPFDSRGQWCRFPCCPIIHMRPKRRTGRKKYLSNYPHCLLIAVNSFSGLACSVRIACERSSAGLWNRSPLDRPEFPQDLPEWPRRPAAFLDPDGKRGAGVQVLSRKNTEGISIERRDFREGGCRRRGMGISGLSRFETDPAPP